MAVWVKANTYLEEYKLKLFQEIRVSNTTVYFLNLLWTKYLCSQKKYIYIYSISMPLCMLQLGKCDILLHFLRIYVA